MSEALPDRYDAAALQTVLRALERRIDAMPGAAPPARAASAPEPTSLALRFPSGGTYGGAADPRVAEAAAISEAVAADGAQRFRIGAGLVLPPLMRSPICRVSPAGVVPSPSPWDVDVVVFGAFARVPHALGAPPRQFRRLQAFDDRGPIAQRVDAAGGSKLSGALRLDVDFFPVFGRTPEDVELALKHFVGFAGAGSAVSTFGFSTTSFVDYENPDLAREHAAALVTTDESFGGVVVTCAWGLGALAHVLTGTSGGGGALQLRYGSGPLGGRTFSTVYQEDPRLNAPLPWGGPSMAGVFIDKDAPVTLSALLADGTRVALSRGAIAWEIAL